MSDENDKNSRRSSKTNGSQAAGDNVTSHGIGEGEPTPKNLEFYLWLESLFDGEGEFPEKIVWQVVEGKKLDRLGAIVNSVTYRPKSPKPSREELVKLSNKIIADCQYDCNVQRRQVTYQVSALHFAKDSDYYSRQLIACAPRPLGSGHPDPRDSNDEEESTEKNFGVQVMRHQEAMVPLLGASFEGMLDRQDRIIVRQQQRITELENRCNQQAEMIERLQSLRHERERQAKWDDLKLQSVEKGVGLVMQMAPPMVAQLMGNKSQNKQSLEAVTLSSFINKLSEKQALALLGKWQDGEWLAPGIFDKDQASILIFVSLCQMEVDRLDELLPGGPHEVTNEQMMQVLGEGVSMEQLMPIRVLFEGRMKKRSQPPAAAQG